MHSIGQTKLKLFLFRSKCSLLQLSVLSFFFCSECQHTASYALQKHYRQVITYHGQLRRRLACSLITHWWLIRKMALLWLRWLAMLLQVGWEARLLYSPLADPVMFVSTSSTLVSICARESCAVTTTVSATPRSRPSRKQEACSASLITTNLTTTVSTLCDGAKADVVNLIKLKMQKVCFKSQGQFCWES